MRTALLRGREHTLLGGISAIAEGPAAIAISRGGAAKTYAYRDPNEDAAAFATSPFASVVAVADGHSGHGAAEIALDRLLDAHAAAWLERTAHDLAARWVDAAVDVLVDLNTTVLNESAAERSADGARTTLSLLLARPGDDCLAYFSVGDSHIFAVDDAGAHEVAAARSPRVGFLGRPSDDRAALRRKLRAGVAQIETLRAVVLATDGLSEPGIGVADPGTAVAEIALRCARGAPDLRPLELARGIVETALASHRAQRSGDNVATAVVWIR